MSGSWWWRRVCEGGRVCRLRGCLGEGLGWWRGLAERLREPWVSELGAGGWCRWGLPNEWFLVVEESL